MYAARIRKALGTFREHRSQGRPGVAGGGGARPGPERSASLSLCLSGPLAFISVLFPARPSCVPSCLLWPLSGSASFCLLEAASVPSPQPIPPCLPATPTPQPWPSGLLLPFPSASSVSGSLGGQGPWGCLPCTRQKGEQSGLSSRDCTPFPLCAFVLPCLSPPHSVKVIDRLGGQEQARRGPGSRKGFTKTCLPFLGPFPGPWPWGSTHFLFSWGS